MKQLKFNKAFEMQKKIVEIESIISSLEDCDITQITFESINDVFEINATTTINHIIKALKSKLTYYRNEFDKI